jgi:hypothetical protein
VKKLEEYIFHSFIVGFKCVDVEEGRFWSSCHSFGRQMAEHFMKFINWHILGMRVKG